MFTSQELQALETLAQREGVQAVFDAMVECMNSRREAIAAALASALTVTVTDWDAVAAGASNTALKALPPDRILSKLATALNAKDQTQLGVLFVALAASVRGYLGK